MVGERGPRYVTDRLREHQQVKTWWADVDRIDVAECIGLIEVRAEERRQISALDPEHNDRHKPVRVPVTPAAAVPLVPEASAAVPAKPNRQAAPLDRYNPAAHSFWHSGFPHEWPADLWCIDWYNVLNDPGYGRLCYEDFMRVHDGGVGPWEPQDFLRDRAQARKEEWTHVAWWQRGPQGTWIVGFSLIAGDETSRREISDVAWEQQRRFLFALLRAGRCTSVQVGPHAWAAGIRDEQEARVTSSVLESIAYEPHSAATATACLEARYREPALYKSAWGWFSYQCEVCDPYSDANADASSDPTCSCPGYCGHRDCRLADALQQMRTWTRRSGKKGGPTLRTALKS
jgi:hypothetical protein